MTLLTRSARQLLKQYGTMPSEDGSPTARRYSPNAVTSIEKRVISGSPDPDHINTSHVERQNLSMRMGMRRMTRLTNGFSKKVENLAAAVALYFMHYNFGRRPRRSARTRRPRWRQGSAITSGHARKSQPCWAEPRSATSQSLPAGTSFDAVSRVGVCIDPADVAARWLHPAGARPAQRLLRIGLRRTRSP